MLYRIAVCDDSDTDRQKISDYLLSYSKKFSIEFKIDQFSQGEDLIEVYKQNRNRYDILFLDVEMGRLGGMGTAEQIRLIPDRNVMIVFVTSYPEYMQDSFDVQASQYLIKPLKYDVFCEKLHKMLCYFHELETNVKMVSRKGEEIILHLDEIVCVETLKSLKSVLLVTTLEGEMWIKGKIAEFEKELMDQFFISVHRSVLVNMRYIKRFNTQYMELITGKTIQVSRRKLPEIKEAFSKYMVMRYTK